MEVRLKRDILERHILMNAVSIRDFARAAQLSNGYCSQLLSGERQPAGRARQKLLNATGLNFDQLFDIDSHDNANH